MLFALTTSGRVDVVVAAAFVIWVGLAAMSASYGSGRGFRFWPLFIAAVFVGFPWVLLAVAIASGVVDEVRLLADRFDDAVD